MAENQQYPNYAYLFDLYGVVLTPDSPEHMRRIREVLGPGEVAEKAYRIYHELRPEIDAGKIDDKQYWDLIKSRSGLQRHIDLAEAIEADYTDLTVLDHGVYELIIELKNAGHKVGILSNLPAELARRVLADHEHWFAKLDAVNLSCDIGVAKPAPEAFQIAVASLGVPAGEIMFIDDSQANIAAAKAEGLNAVHYTGLEKLKVDLL